MKVDFGDLEKNHSTWEAMQINLKRGWIWCKAHIFISVAGLIVLSSVSLGFLVYHAEAGVQGGNINSFGDALWWAVVTLLTVGYGDKYPVTSLGRVWACFLMFSGVFSVAILTSKIASIFLEQVLAEGRGLVKTSELSDHFVVCGWKEDMEDLLTHILDFNAGLKDHQLVLVANPPVLEFENLRQNSRLSGVQIIHGDPSQAQILRRAAPERARKVLILADQSPHASGAAPSLTEIDARTIMTAMTLSNLARGTMVAAEVLDPKMDQYLKMAHVTEVIYSREYSRLLLGNASSGTGISNIVFDLLDPSTPARIQTWPISEEWIGRSYRELKADLEQNFERVVVIGLLQNTGNSHRIKENALRQAQKTPDIKKLVDNLKSVKDIRFNDPVFNPEDRHVIMAGSMAIVVAYGNIGGVSHGTQKAIAA